MRSQRVNSWMRSALVALAGVAGAVVPLAPASAQDSSIPAGPALTFRAFATQYEPHVEGSVEIAVPDKCAKWAALGQTTNLATRGCPSGYALNLDYRVVVTRDNGRSAVIPVKEVGPWNIDDNWWDPPHGPRPRRLFADLPQGVPEAREANAGRYNVVPDCLKLDGTPSGRSGGADQFGRCVLNPAGVDLSFAAAAALGLGPGQNETVTVSFLWERPLATWPAVTRGDNWYLRYTRTSGPADVAFRYGAPTDIPVFGDWNGDGTRTPGVFRDGTWYLRNSASAGTGDIVVQYGEPGDVPVVGDWNGDGTDTVGIFRKGIWHLRNSNTSGPGEILAAFGNPDDLPVVGDWNNDRLDTLGVFRRGVWHLTNRVSSGPADAAFSFGSPGDDPVVGDWNGDGTDTLGVFRGGTWYLTDFFDRGVAEMTFRFAAAGDRPAAWR